MFTFYSESPIGTHNKRDETPVFHILYPFVMFLLFFLIYFIEFVKVLFAVTLGGLKTVTSKNACYPAIHHPVALRCTCELPCVLTVFPEQLSPESGSSNASVLISLQITFSKSAVMSYIWLCLIV